MKNILIADDHAVLRQALCEMLESKGNYKILGQAGDGEELLTLLKTHKPDLIIMDLEMPKLNGIEAIEQLSKLGDTPPVLVLSANEGQKNVRSAMKAGAKGYVPKNAGLEELEFAISSILGGKTYLSPTITDALMKNGEASPVHHEQAISVLSPREIEILTHLADGMPNREIGKMLHISPRTVDTHRSNILRKLKVRTNAELVKIAIGAGLITV